MRGRSLRWKITLWFAVILAVMTALSYGVFFSVNRSVLRKGTQDNLIETVANNIDEVEYFATLADGELDQDGDLYLPWGSGWIEVDDDFLDLINGISTALCQSDGSLLYGEDPLLAEELPLADDLLRTLSLEGTEYYLYDRQLTGEGLDGLWLRGVVSQQQSTAQLSSTARYSLFLLPLLAILALLGGWFIAGRALLPIRRIADAASRISHGRDLKQRIALGSGRDELHQLADTFDQMFARLEEAFAAERQFTSDASHELRTPISVILAQCDYTLESPRSPQEYQEALDVIQRQGGRMSRLIGELLDFSRLERQTDHFSLEEINLSDLITELCGDLALLEDQGITLTWQVQPGIFIRGNGPLLSRLLTNLVSNAYRYGLPQGHIWVSLSAEDTAIVLAVKDDGIGIAPEEQEAVFHRFFQHDSAHSGQGSGLGLAMAAEIARFHHGSLTVASVPGQGSTFTLTLPSSPSFSCSSHLSPV